MRRRVSIVGSVCVCLLSQISPLECLFILKILSCTQWATEVKKIVGFSLKPLLCRDPALLRESHTYNHHFPAEGTHAHYSQYHMSGPLCELPLVMHASKQGLWHKLMAPHFSAFI